MKEKILSLILRCEKPVNIICTAFKKVHSRIKARYDKNPIRFAFVHMFILWPMLLFFIMQCMELKSVGKGIRFIFHSPLIFIANSLIVALTLSIALLTRRRLFLVSVLSAVWLAFGISNLVLLLNRVTPFTANDLFLIESLFEVIQKYFNNFQIVLIGILVAFALAGLVVLFFKAPRIKRKMYYLNDLAAIAIFFVLAVGSVRGLVMLDIMEGQFAELSAAYRNNGFVYCFTNSLIDNASATDK